MPSGKKRHKISTHKEKKIKKIDTKINNNTMIMTNY